MKTKLVLIALASLSVAIAGCTGDDTTTPHENPPDSGTTADSSTGGDSGIGSDGGADSGVGEPDCYMNPKTHHEIINACTDAQPVDKKPVLPLLQPDGSLPQLP